jgi:hypothetical protein
VPLTACLVPQAQLVCLTDLENDFINPFDLSSKLNRFVVSAARGVRVWGANGELCAVQHALAYRTACHHRAAKLQRAISAQAVCNPSSFCHAFAFVHVCLMLSPHRSMSWERKQC